VDTLAVFRCIRNTDEVGALKNQTEADLKKYVDFARKLGFRAENRSSVGTEAVERVLELAEEIRAEYPRSIFFLGVLVFEEDNLLHRILHNETALAMQRRLQFAGLEAVVLPIREMAALCHRRGVPVAIDGAHAPGHIALDVPRLGVDWYVGNLHKWAFAAKGTAVIWCAPEHQKALHPTAISHALGHGFTPEFDYTGTRDNSAWLAVPAALDYIDGLGPEALRAHNAALAREAGAMLTLAWDSEAAAAPEFCASMVSVRLPVGFLGGAGDDRDAARTFAARLNEEHGITAGIMVLDGGLWVRVSAQIYNEIDDYARLAAIGKTLAG